MPAEVIAFTRIISGERAYGSIMDIEMAWWHAGRLSTKAESNEWRQSVMQAARLTARGWSQGGPYQRPVWGLETLSLLLYGHTLRDFAYEVPVAELAEQLRNEALPTIIEEGLIRYEHRLDDDADQLVQLYKKLTATRPVEPPPHTDLPSMEAPLIGGTEMGWGKGFALSCLDTFSSAGRRTA